MTVDHVVGLSSERLNAYTIMAEKLLVGTQGSGMYECALYRVI
jgi:hypothetical protein